jgi:hypothetical protein
MSGGGIVYPRDASWNATGRPSGKTLKLHFPAVDDFALSACGRVALSNRTDDNAGVRAETVAAYRRCMAPGCREQWVAGQGENDGGA